MMTHIQPRMSERTLDYFLSRRRITNLDAAEIRWSHAANSRSRLTEAVTGSTHMIEADIIMRGHDPREPVMAHPPETDSDITLREWLEVVKEHEKGIKLDFKSLEAVPPAVALLQELFPDVAFPIWINADVLPGPGGVFTPLDPQSFLAALETLPSNIVLSLGWTTGWSPETLNPGYSWDMVRAMQDVCRPLRHAVTFPVRAALLDQSLSQLTWLLQQEDSHSLTVWTGQNDSVTLADLLPYRTNFDVRRVYYDLPDSVRTEISRMPRDSD